jgi:hypothetical protein
MCGCVIFFFFLKVSMKLWGNEKVYEFFDHKLAQFETWYMNINSFKILFFFSQKWLYFILYFCREKNFHPLRTINLSIPWVAIKKNDNETYFSGFERKKKLFPFSFHSAECENTEIFSFALSCSHLFTKISFHRPFVWIVVYFFSLSLPQSLNVFSLSEWERESFLHIQTVKCFSLHRISGFWAPFSVSLLALSLARSQLNVKAIFRTFYCLCFGVYFTAFYYCHVNIGTANC